MPRYALRTTSGLDVVESTVDGVGRALAVHLSDGLSPQSVGWLVEDAGSVVLHGVVDLPEGCDRPAVIGSAVDHLCGALFRLSAGALMAADQRRPTP